MPEFPRLLIIDSDEPFVNDLSDGLAELGYRVFTAPDRQAGGSVLSEKKALVVLLGMNQSKEDALEDLRWIKSHFPFVEVIVFAQRGHFRTAFSAMSLNAYDFLIKSPNIGEFVPIIDQAYHQAHDQYKRRSSRGEAWAKIRANFSDMIGQSEGTRKIVSLIAKVAPTDSSVFILGETGVGKELAARLIHQNSRRRNGPFVPINCGAIPETLLENELFGHAKGAFTDSVQLKHGLLEEANGGTIFLDEVSELSPALQVKLLRLIETGAFRRLGDNKERHVDMRIISATNRNIAQEIRLGRFRTDFYYRLAVVIINIPPLRSRRDDIPPLVEHFLRLYEPPQKGEQKKISSSAMQILIEYDWPGNAREVKNMMERLVILSENKIITAAGIADIIPLAGDYQTFWEQLETPVTAPSLISLEEMEKQHIQRVLNTVNGNLLKASEILKISPQALTGKLQNYSITVN